jgi:hypothetical protein
MMHFWEELLEVNSFLMKERITVCIRLFTIIILFLMLLGCKRQQERVEVVTVAPTASQEVQVLPNPSVAAVLAELPTDTPLPLPTPTPSSNEFICEPPSDWQAYEIQPNDTLISLAERTQTSIDLIKAANCILDADTYILVVGDILYLPFIPAALPILPPVEPLSPTEVSSTEVSPTEVPSIECANELCPNDQLDGTLTLDPGGPNNSNYRACESGNIIEFDTTTTRVEIGQRRYFYVCDFAPTIAMWTNEYGEQSDPIIPLLEVPDPDMRSRTITATAVIDWAPLPIHRTGDYTMTISNESGMTEHFTFEVRSPSESRILVVPQLLEIPEEGESEKSLEVYFVNFDLNLDTPMTFNLYGGEGEKDRLPTLRHQWNDVLINKQLQDMPNKGWAQRTLVFTFYNQPSVYAVSTVDQGVIGRFWLE